MSAGYAPTRDITAERDEYGYTSPASFRPVLLSG